MAKGFTSTLTSQQKTIGVSNPTDLLNVSFLNHFETLTDPRIERSKEHLLIDIVAIAILAVISGADGWGAIELYGKTKYECRSVESEVLNDRKKLLKLVEQCI
ncbi:transposase family protein, partial [Microcoleus sp. herbarium19]|uniref:transposase family protein n=1 Tax=unclassified Microcoleus TaxID=2642155 RepID=UPI002FD40688